MNENTERDNLLLDALMELVPYAGGLIHVAEWFEANDPQGADSATVKMLKGYGMLINVIQAAQELGDLLPEGDLYARLSAGYYELTNAGGDPDEQIRLREEDED